MKFSLSLETTGLNPRKDRIRRIGFYDGEKSRYRDLQQDGEETVLRRTKALLENEDNLWIGHGIKSDLKFLHAWDVRPRCKIACTFIAAWLLDENTHNYQLERCIERDLNHKVPASKAVAAFDLWSVYEPKLKEEGLERAFWELEMPAAAALADMELTGVPVDCEYLVKYAGELKVHAEEAEQRLYELVGYPFDLSSPKQLSEALFHVLGIKPPDGVERTKPGYWPTNERVLKQLRHEAVDLVIAYRHKTKLASTYVLPLLEDAAQDALGIDRVYTAFHQTGTATGRLSSSIWQCVPKEKDAIKQGIIAPPEHDIIAADYDQAELRVLAFCAKEPKMQEAFTKGVDFHQAVADEMGNTRDQAKAVNFGVIYGMTAYGLARQLNISQAEADGILQGYFRKYRRLKAYAGELLGSLREKGYIRTLSGRKRRLAKGDQVTPRMERQAVNARIQGSTADLIKIAMRNIYRERDKRATENADWLGLHILLQVHDNLILITPSKIRDAAHDLVRHEMEHAIPSIPMRVDIGIGKTWEAAEEAAKK